MTYSWLACWVLICLVLNSVDVLAQADQGLQAAGKVPLDFRQNSVIRSAEASQKITTKGAEAKEERDFIFTSNYSLDNALQSGRVIFNDPISTYLNQLLDRILAHDDSLRQAMRIYTLRSYQVNAFSTDQGVLMVTLGLLERLENEAQLAFVLSHEISHFVQQHNYESYAEGRKIAEGRGIYGALQLGERDLARARYSRDIEAEADRLGMELFLKTGFDPREAVKALQLLDYTHAPARNVPFDFNLLTRKGHELPSALLLPTVNPIQPDTTADSLSYHPAIPQRIGQLNERFAAPENTGKRLFQVSEATFLNVKAIAAQEVTQSYYLADNYEKVLYNCFTLLDHSEDTKVLKKRMAASLLIMAQYGNITDPQRYNHRYKRAQGPIQNLYYVLSQLSARDLNLLAISFHHNLLEAYPEDRYIKDGLHVLLEELIHNYFAGAHQWDELQAVIQRTTEAEANSPLTAILKSNKSTSGQLPTTALLDQWANGYLTSSDLQNLIKTHLDSLDLDPFTEEEMDLQTHKESRKEKGKEFRNGIRMGIDKVLLIDPVFVYSKWSGGKRNPQKQIVRSEKRQQRMVDLLEDMSDRAGTQLTLFENTRMTADDVDQFNEQYALKTWLSRSTDHLDIELPLEESDAIQPILDKYDTDHLGWCGIITIQRQRVGTEIPVYLSIVPVFGWGYIGYKRLKPKYRSYYAFVVANGRTRKFEYFSGNATERNSRKDQMNSQLYNQYIQVIAQP